MKHKTLLAVILVTALNFFYQDGYSLNKPPVKVAAKKGPHRKAVVVKHNKYSRTKVVVVKNRPNKKIGVLPQNFTSIKYKNNHYYYANGVYYKPINNYYLVTYAPIGLKIRTVPSTHKVIIVNKVNYYYAQGTYYTLDSNQYKVVETPVGAIVNDLPEEHDEVTIDNQTYYEYNNYLYKKVNEGYKVVGKVEE